jgi:hypothetical protein
MQTPFGQECRYFYGDYFRGKNHEECRLLGTSTSKQNWTSKLCKSCPVPGIILANACQSMVLKGYMSTGFLGIGKSMKITAYCEKSKSQVNEPQIGCGLCHPIADIFTPKE